MHRCGTKAWRCSGTYNNQYCTFRSLDATCDQQNVDLKRQLQVIEQEANVLRAKTQALEADNEKLQAENKKLQVIFIR